MWLALFQLALIAYVPGALIYRLPIADRNKRAALAAEERVFWGVMISVAITSAVVLALAALEVYSFRALLAIDALIAIGVAIAGNTRLVYRGTARRPTATALIPVAIVAAGLWLYFPAAEYIMGGKDPGSYVNEGIQIAQRGSLITYDQTVASVPAPFRELFFPSYNNPYYFSSRFMGFFLIDAGEGTVLGQFPHLLPAWIAVGYGLDGLTGTRNAIAVWTMLALVAIYLTGARLFGIAAAAAGTALVAINVIEVWFGRYPNAEILMQALLFAALLAWSRAHVDDDGFFAPVSATLLGLLLFLRFDAVLALGGIVVSAALGLATGRRPRASFIITLALWLAFASWYLFGLMKPYMEYPIGFISNLAIWQMIALVLGGLALVAFAVTASRLAPADTSPADTSPADTSIVRRLDVWPPAIITVVVLILATYAYFFRAEGGGIAIHDAMALRTFAWYVTPLGLAAALGGYVLAMRTTFRRDSALLATVTIFGLFFFYKIKIVPVHFWMARRFLPVLLPGAMLLVGYLAFEGLRALTAKLQPMPQRLVRGTVGVIVVALLGMSFWRASQPVLNHVEYSGIIPKMEALAKQFGDRDLVVVESRASGSELHVLALPLAYVYARHVLVLNTPRPDPMMFREFLSWARTHYDNVFFLGGGGTDLLTRSIGIVPVTSERFQVPEWESPLNALPRGARGKMFDLAVYKFVDAARTLTTNGRGTILDVGAQDDVNVVRFHLKERDAHGVTYRWTQDASYISLVGIRPENQELVLTLNDGHRPTTQPPCRVQVTLDDQVLGYVDVGRDFHVYTVPIPSTVAAAAAARETPARLKLAVTTWKPRDVLGTPDDRQLGVMVDRVEVR